MRTGSIDEAMELSDRAARASVQADGTRIAPMKTRSMLRERAARAHEKAARAWGELEYETIASDHLARMIDYTED